MTDAVAFVLGVQRTAAAVPGGTMLALRARRVMATGTTATALVGLV